MDKLLKDKIALITGGALGIGRGIATAFAEQGATVVVADINSAALADLESEFTRQNWKYHGLECDVTDSKQIRSLMDYVDETLGKLDILVNNVGDFLGLIKPLEKMSDEDIDSLYNINLRHVMLCTRDAIPLLRNAGGGSIISISSIEGYRGMPNIAPYAAAKLAVEGFTKTMALELGGDGIRINVIAPETTETEQVRPGDFIAPEDLQRENHWIPLGRFGQPGDLAGCALFLACEMSAWVTGTTIHCDGGALAAAGWYRTPEGDWTNTPIVDRSAMPSMTVE